MSHESDSEDPLGSAVSNRTMNIVVSLVLMAVAVVVMVNTYLLGAGWAKGLGPDSGYFPFYIALIMFCASGVTVCQHVFLHRGEEEGSFVGRGELKMVLQVLVPTAMFVVLAIYIGIYIPIALFILFFMTWHGRYPIWKALPIAVLVPVALFVIFEVWFLVPLPKGPFEHWLGY